MCGVVEQFNGAILEENNGSISHFTFSKFESCRRNFAKLPWQTANTWVYGWRKILRPSTAKKPSKKLYEIWNDGILKAIGFWC